MGTATIEAGNGSCFKLKGLRVCAYGALFMIDEVSFFESIDHSSMVTMMTLPQFSLPPLVSLWPHKTNGPTSTTEMNRPKYQNGPIVLSFQAK